MTAALVTSMLLLFHDLNVKRLPCQCVALCPGSGGNTGASCRKGHIEASGVREKSEHLPHIRTMFYRLKCIFTGLFHLTWVKNLKRGSLAAHME